MSANEDRSVPSDVEKKPDRDSITFCSVSQSLSRDYESYIHVQPASLSQGYESEPIGPRKSNAFRSRIQRLKNCNFSAMKRERTKPRNEHRLCQAVCLNDTAKVTQLLQRGVSPSCVDQQRRTPLHLAACKGYSDIVRILLRFGADPNMRDSVGNTPLHLAACTHHIDVIMLLLQAGTNACSIDQLGRSPLQLAQSKLRILQMSKDPTSTVKHQVSQVIDMLMMFSENSSPQSELLSDFQKKLNVENETKEHVDTQLQNLLDNLSSMSLENKPPASQS